MLLAHVLEQTSKCLQAQGPRRDQERLRLRCSCNASRGPDEPQPAHTYNSSDGRPKATIEQAGPAFQCLAL